MTNITEKLNRLQNLIKDQEKKLRTNNSAIENTKINKNMETGQKELRNKMLQVEKEFIETKYGCYDFLSDNMKLNS